MAVQHTWKVIGKEYTGMITMGKAIRQHCIDCSGGYRLEVNRCHITTCALYPFRSGKDPSKKQNLTERQKTAAMINLKKAHESKSQK
jgi:hypothetical protein